MYKARVAQNSNTGEAFCIILPLKVRRLNVCVCAHAHTQMHVRERERVWVSACVRARFQGTSFLVCSEVFSESARPA